VSTQRPSKQWNDPLSHGDVVVFLDENAVVTATAMTTRTMRPTEQSTRTIPRTPSCSFQEIAPGSTTRLPSIVVMLQRLLTLTFAGYARVDSTPRPCKYIAAVLASVGCASCLVSIGSNGCRTCSDPSGAHCFICSGNTVTLTVDDTPGPFSCASLRGLVTISYFYGVDCPTVIAEATTACCDSGVGPPPPPPPVPGSPSSPAGTRPSPQPVKPSPTTPVPPSTPSSPTTPSLPKAPGAPTSSCKMSPRMSPGMKGKMGPMARKLMSPKAPMVSGSAKAPSGKGMVTC
jgi:hypothetical protein